MLGASLSACSSSPPAAIVNGQVITQPELSHYLQGWESSPAYVSGFDQASKAQSQQYAAEGETVPAFTVVGTGSGPGNFGLPWTTGKLTELVTGMAVRQYLESRHETPSYIELSAAWAGEEADLPQVWPQLPAALRSSVAQDSANLALVQTKAPNLRTAEQFYKTGLSSFWSQVCLTTLDATVSGPNGTVDMAASRKQAEAIVSQVSTATSGAAASSVAVGARYCLTPEQLIEEPLEFRQQVYGLAPGKAGIVPQSWGYEVVLVRSRTIIPFNAQVATVIGVVALGAGTDTYSWPVQGDTSDTGLIKVLKAASVKVDPAFGSWTTALPTPPYIPQVWPAGESNP